MDACAFVSNKISQAVGSKKAKNKNDKLEDKSGETEEDKSNPNGLPAPPAYNSLYSPPTSEVAKDPNGL